MTRWGVWGLRRQSQPQYNNKTTPMAHDLAPSQPLRVPAAGPARGYLSPGSQAACWVALGEPSATPRPHCLSREAEAVQQQPRHSVGLRVLKGGDAAEPPGPVSAQQPPAAPRASPLTAVAQRPWQPWKCYWCSNCQSGKLRWAEI